LYSSKNITGINKPERIKYTRQENMLGIKEMCTKTWPVNLTGKTISKSMHGWEVIIKRNLKERYLKHYLASSS
jgi:hypothetical protein